MATALALSPAHGRPAEISADAWQQARWLPCQLRAEIPVHGFTVGDLLRLEVGSILNSRLPIEADVSIRVNGAHLGCAKLDPIGSRLAVCLTELV